MMLLFLTVISWPVANSSATNKTGEMEEPEIEVDPAFVKKEALLPVCFPEKEPETLGKEKGKVQEKDLYSFIMD